MHMPEISLYMLAKGVSQREFRRQRAEVRREAWRESVDDEVGALARLQSAFGMGALGGICASFLVEAIFHHEPLGDIPEKCACLAGAAVSAAKYQSLAVRSSVNCCSMLFPVLLSIIYSPWPVINGVRVIFRLPFHLRYVLRFCALCSTIFFVDGPGQHFAMTCGMRQIG